MLINFNIFILLYIYIIIYYLLCIVIKFNMNAYSFYIIYKSINFNLPLVNESLLKLIRFLTVYTVRSFSPNFPKDVTKALHSYNFVKLR